MKMLMIYLVMGLLWMTKLIAETACHHEGDYPFMKELVTRIVNVPSSPLVVS